MVLVMGKGFSLKRRPEAPPLNRITAKGQRTDFLGPKKKKKVGDLR